MQVVRLSKSKLMFAVTTLFLIILWSCKITYHREEDAAPLANEFAKAAYIQHDFKTAYSLMAPELVKMAPEDKFLELAEKMNPLGRPKRFESFEYELLPGQEGILIFAQAVFGDSKRYYRFLTHGDGRTGYKIAGFWSSDKPYPRSSMPRRSITVK